MKVIRSDDTQDTYGLVFQHGDVEVHGIKLQPVDISETDANKVLIVNRALIAAALPFYLEKQHRGVMLPCAYIQEKTTGLFESGLAFFVGPDAASIKEKTTGLFESGLAFFVGPDAASRYTSRKENLYDDRLGAGATQMIFDMAAATSRASKEIGFPLMTVIGVDLRPRLAIGAIVMDFIVEGPRVIVVKKTFQEGDPVWMLLVEHLVSAGFSTLPHAPMQTVSLPGPLPEDTPRA
jgi:hypothetical protein